MYSEAVSWLAAVYVVEHEGGLLVAGRDAEVAANEQLIVVLKIAQLEDAVGHQVAEYIIANCVCILVDILHMNSTPKAVYCIV